MDCGYNVETQVYEEEESNAQNLLYNEDPTEMSRCLATVGLGYKNMYLYVYIHPTNL